jgi:hypothetical protein
LKEETEKEKTWAYGGGGVWASFLILISETMPRRRAPNPNTIIIVHKNGI